MKIDFYGSAHSWARTFDVKYITMFQRHIVQNEHMMFVTTNTEKRIPIFSNPAYARESIETLYRVQQLHPFFLFAFTIMPDHCHLLLKVPSPEKISTIMNSFKAGVSHNIGIGPIWQSRFDLKIVTDSKPVIVYIHRNPVVAGLAHSPEEYPWSSASGKWGVSPLDIW
jgi:putative transposase